MPRLLALGFGTCGLAAGGAIIGLRLEPADATTAAPAQRAAAPTPSPSGLVAALRRTIVSYKFPGGPMAAPIEATWYGSPLNLPVIASRDGDLDVRLPTRPNGSTAWVRRSDVTLYETPYRIVVDLGRRHLMLYKSGELVLDAAAGIGSSSDPTPTGHFFVAFFTTAPSPAWGPFLLVTSAHSTTISDWEGSGDAVVAIHGPLGEAGAIGTSGAMISHGCIRLQDAALARLRTVPAGSPIDIIA